MPAAKVAKRPASKGTVKNKVVTKTKKKGDARSKPAVNMTMIPDEFNPGSFCAKLLKLAKLKPTTKGLSVATGCSGMQLQCDTKTKKLYFIVLSVFMSYFLWFSTGMGTPVTTCRLVLGKGCPVKEIFASDSSAAAVFFLARSSFPPDHVFKDCSRSYHRAFVGDATAPDLQFIQ